MSGVPQPRRMRIVRPGTGALLAGVGVVMALLATGCTSNFPSPAGSGGTASGDDPVPAYTKVEVREYKGQKLSSVADEPENSIKGPQSVDPKTYQLTIDGLVGRPVSLSYSDVTSMTPTKRVIELHCVEGWTMTYLWDGIPLIDLIERAGGASSEATVVVFHCVDGYTSSLPLDYVRRRNILLGYRMNGVEMPPERGFPFQVLAEDRFGYKWAKWVERIELSSDAKYLGYWEKRGYDNDAVLPGKD
ncbi:MAG: molybdopterin-dependent oxidoreductase [Coriobacteriia bacterium]|nr:molybdopterin-dependent oxidoreductase [Coriobacteriia bacterium]